MPTFGSLFTGIGGLDLGLERAGWTCAWQVEIDDYCNRVLQRHWPDVPRWRDVRTWGPECPGWKPVDLVCGGFPCQDVSQSNHNAAGLDGARSGLYREILRISSILRPRYLLLENVPALLYRGLSRVLCDLAALGLDAEWESVPAEAFGAPHGRDRVFIVAYPAGKRPDEVQVFTRKPFASIRAKREERLRSWPGQFKSSDKVFDRVRWIPDPRICRMVDGIPDFLDPFRGLGNAVVPQVAEYIGRLILEHWMTTSTEDNA